MSETGEETVAFFYRGNARFLEGARGRRRAG